MPLEVNPRSQSQYTVLSSAAAVTVKSGAGFLQSIILNNAGTAWEIDVYDGAGTTATRIAAIRNASVPTVLRYDLPFTQGLYIDGVKGTTAGDLIVNYN